jgi:hypothetical protein
MADDINKLAVALGIDPALLTGQSSSADDPPIYLGKTHASAGYDTELGGQGKNRTTYIEKTQPYSTYLTSFYGLNKDALTQFQTRAYQAGLYGNAKPRYGDPNDDVAYAIWSDIGKRAAGFQAAGQKFTPGDVLDMAVQSAPADQRQARAYETRTDVVRSEDPATVRAAAHAAFKEITGKGRKVDDAKIRKFVEVFTAKQVGEQRRVNSAQDSAATAARAAQDTADAGGTPADSPVSQEVRQVMPDLGADAAEYAQASDPAAAGAHAITKQFDSFLRLLGGVI